MPTPICTSCIKLLPSTPTLSCHPFPSLNSATPTCATCRLLSLPCTPIPNELREKLEEVLACHARWREALETGEREMAGLASGELRGVCMGLEDALEELERGRIKEGKGEGEAGAGRYDAGNRDGPGPAVNEPRPSDVRSGKDVSSVTAMEKPATAAAAATASSKSKSKRRGKSYGRPNGIVKKAVASRSSAVLKQQSQVRRSTTTTKEPESSEREDVKAGVIGEASEGRSTQDADVHLDFVMPDNAAGQQHANDIVTFCTPAAHQMLPQGDESYPPYAALTLQPLRQHDTHYYDPPSTLPNPTASSFNIFDSPLDLSTTDYSVSSHNRDSDLFQQHHHETLTSSSPLSSSVVGGSTFLLNPQAAMKGEGERHVTSGLFSVPYLPSSPPSWHAARDEHGASAEAGEGGETLGYAGYASEAGAETMIAAGGSAGYAAAGAEGTGRVDLNQDISLRILEQLQTMNTTMSGMYEMMRLRQQ